jgi:hypothetical protein
MTGMMDVVQLTLLGASHLPMDGEMQLRKRVYTITEVHPEVVIMGHVYTLLVVRHVLHQLQKLAAIDRGGKFRGSFGEGEFRGHTT